MQINAKSTLYDSTSGNTGSAEAYMARLIGVPFVAVVGSQEEIIQAILERFWNLKSQLQRLFHYTNHNS